MTARPGEVSEAHKYENPFGFTVLDLVLKQRPIYERPENHMFFRRRRACPRLRHASALFRNARDDGLALACDSFPGRLVGGAWLCGAALGAVAGPIRGRDQGLAAGASAFWRADGWP